MRAARNRANGTMARPSPRLPFALAAAIFGGLAPAMADSGATAQALVALSVESDADLVFGTVLIPGSGQCVYRVDPDGATEATGGSGCGFVTDAGAPAAFSVGCTPDALVRFEAIFENSAPPGAAFGASDSAVAIDARAAGPLAQVAPCDRDGLTEIRIGGALTLNAGASEFDGAVGTIRLEAIYD